LLVAPAASSAQAPATGTSSDVAPEAAAPSSVNATNAIAAIPAAPSAEPAAAGRRRDDESSATSAPAPNSQARVGRA